MNKPTENWKFLFTRLPNIKKAVTRTGSPKPKVTHYIIIEGGKYSECLNKAMSEGKFKESQLLGARKLPTDSTIN